MTKEQRIELIKWSCENGYADGFGPIETEPRLMCKVPVSSNHLCSEHIYIEDCAFWDNIYYPLFLQRTIEGINRIFEEWRITQTNSLVLAILKEESGDAFMLKNYPTIDQAKESALLYIMEEMNK